MTNFLLSNLSTLTYAGIFIAGLFIKSPLQKDKTNSDILETMSKDFQSLKILYDAKLDDLKNRDQQIAQLKEDLARVQARCTSYENFLQSRTYETDKLLKQLPTVLQAVAKQLNVPLENTGLTGHEAAHSQIK